MLNIQIEKYAIDVAKECDSILKFIDKEDKIYSLQECVTFVSHWELWRCRLMLMNLNSWHHHEQIGHKVSGYKNFMRKALYLKIKAQQKNLS